MLWFDEGRPSSAILHEKYFRAATATLDAIVFELPPMFYMDVQVGRIRDLICI
jgi:hypothetical protein